MASDFVYPLVYVTLVFGLAGYLLRAWQKTETTDSRKRRMVSPEDPDEGRGG